MNGSKIRVIQGYTGGIAREQIKMIAAHPRVELVGALVHHEEKVGLDVGEIAGIEPLGVAATNELSQILSINADCVLYKPPVDTLAEVIPMLES
ncbi:MAG: dihydrodipicolinate reductase, partial [Deltaproteobacteria bacterium]|nr:dihydrodipicolinate reductase [Deltaproteobacteria bacterium]